MIARRLSLCLPAVLVVLASFRDRSPAPVPPEPPIAGTPIVAIRGLPLGAHEEPLPAGAHVRIGSTRYRHPNGMIDWRVIRAGRFVVTHDYRSFTLTDVPTGRRVWTDAADQWGEAVASADGTRLVFWNNFPEGGPFARLWEITADPTRPLIPLAVLHLPPTGDRHFIEAVQFTADGKELVVGEKKAVVRYDAASGALLGMTARDLYILGLSADGQRFLAVDDDSSWQEIMSAGMYSSRGRRVPRYRFRPARDREPDPTDDLDDLTAVAPNAKVAPLTVIAGDCRTGNLVGKLVLPREKANRVYPPELSPDGQYLRYPREKAMSVWDVVRGRPVLEISPAPVEKDRWPYFDEAWFSADGRSFVAVQADRPPRQFDLPTGREVVVRGPLPARAPVNSTQGYETRHDLVTEEGVLVPPGGLASLPSGYAGAMMAVSPDGRRIAVGDAAGRLDVWGTNGRLLATLRTGGPAMAALTFSRDSRQLAACDVKRDLRIWSVDTWRVRHQLDVPAEIPELYPDRLTFRPDGRRLLLSRGDIMALWELGAAGWVWDHAGSLSVPRWSPLPFFTPDGRMLFVGNTRLDAETGEGKWSPDFRARAISPDGRTIAGFNVQGMLELREITTGTVVRAFPEFQSRHIRDNTIRFSPDGRRLITWDEAGHAFLWETATGPRAGTLDYPDGDITDAVLLPGGRSVVTCNHREVIVWDLAPDPRLAKSPWDALGHDAPDAEQARRALLADPVGTIRLFQAYLRPAGPVNAATVQRLIGDLDAPSFRDRDRAVAGLRAVGRRVLPYLRDARLESEEGSARLGTLIRDLERGPTVEELRHLRAIEVLEQMDTEAARNLIDRLATGDPEAVLTAEARRARNPS